MAKRKPDMLVVAPHPFFTPRGTPFSVYYRTLVLAEAGVVIDLLTYGPGQDVDIPGCRIIRIPRLNAKVEQLSGGQRQAIAIARAASFTPRILIMDEPTSALAVAEVEAVLRLINALKSRGVAVLLITHRLQDLFEVCDRIAVMYEGTKVAERAIGDTSLEDLVKLIVGKGEAI